MRHRRPRGGPSVLLPLTRYLGAAALLAVGVDHLDQYAVQHYDAIPAIGTLFALNFVSATVVAAGLAVPVERLSRRFGRTILDALALAGAAVAAGSLAGCCSASAKACSGSWNPATAARSCSRSSSRSRPSSCLSGSSPCQTAPHQLSWIVDAPPSDPATTP
jgi:hypothetical protein